MTKRDISEEEGVIFVLLFFATLFMLGYIPVIIEYFQFGRYQ